MSEDVPHITRTNGDVIGVYAQTQSTSTSLDDGHGELAAQRSPSHRAEARRRRPTWAGGGATPSEAANHHTDDKTSRARGELVVPIAPVRVTRATLPSVLVLLLPLLFIVRAVVGVVQGDSTTEVVAGIALALVIGLAYARPVRLIGQSGDVRFTSEGMRVRFDGLLTDEWFVPAANICEVKCANKLRPSSDRGVLGLTGRDADVAVRFLLPSSRVPVRGGFFIPAFLGMNRRSGTMPVPNTTVSEIVWRTGATDLAALQARIGGALAGEAPVEPTYRGGASPSE